MQVLKQSRKEKQKEEPWHNVELEIYRAFHAQWQLEGLPREYAMVVDHKMTRDELMKWTTTAKALPIDNRAGASVVLVSAPVILTQGFSFRHMPLHATIVMLSGHDQDYFDTWAKHGGARELRIYPLLRFIYLIYREHNIRVDVNEVRRKCPGCGIMELDPVPFKEHFPDEPVLQAKYAKFLDCSVCKNTGYCSRECQRKHWAEHRTTCCKQTVPKMDERDVLMGAFLKPIRSLPQ